MRTRVVAAVALLIFSASPLIAETISFTPVTIIDAMGPFHDATHQWGIWAVRAMPLVGGSGLYTITGGSTNQPGWGVSAPNGAFGAPPYTLTNNAWFWDASGSELPGNPSNPLYMIMDVSADTFQSSSFDKTGAAVDWYSPSGIGSGPFYASGYDSGAGGTNLVTQVSSSSIFTFDFTLGAGATWNGSWQFVVDGSEYTRGTALHPGVWVEDFFGGYGDNGALAKNSGGGAVVPEPGSLVLLATGLAATGFAIKRRPK